MSGELLFESQKKNTVLFFFFLRQERKAGLTAIATTTGKTCILHFYHVNNAQILREHAKHQDS